MLLDVLVHTIALSFEHPLVFNALAAGEHKMFKHLSPYLLFVYVKKLLAYRFSPFSAIFFVGIIPGFNE